MDKMRAAEKEGVGQERLQVGQDCRRDSRAAFLRFPGKRGNQSLERSEMIALGVEAVFFDPAEGEKQRGGVREVQVIRNPGGTKTAAPIEKGKDIRPADPVFLTENWAGRSFGTHPVLENGLSLM